MGVIELGLEGLKGSVGVSQEETEGEGVSVVRGNEGGIGGGGSGGTHGDYQLSRQ